MPHDTFEQGLSEVQAHYQKISTKFGFDIKIPEQVLNNLGYNALFKEQLDKALEAFTYNVKMYPNSANVYDSLAEAQEKSGKLKEAYKNYKKAFELTETTNGNKAIFDENKQRVAKLLTQ